ncbi:MAG: DNA primase [Campylobacterales bacterium]|nr:DNA primase [Campylobacterales bacterium]
MIDTNSIESLKNIVDIADIVGEYVTLKKAGVNYKAPCPFHDEKTPSFVVSPKKNIYHCFGCGASGDAIKFVMDYEKLTYPEAIEKIAQKYNFQLKYTESKPKDTIHLLDKINQFYKKNLSINQVALNYLKDRGVFESSIEKFELGYATSSSETINYLKQNFLPIDEATRVGIVGVEQNVYARFIERIMFPIYSYSNKLVGFGGRTITNHPAKYVNSPQTELFNKSELLYGLNIAKESILKQSSLIVVEGYLDVIMLHQAGFTNSVATLGTALTNQHLPLLRRLKSFVLLGYDGDSAGINAALKASKLLIASNIDGGVVIFPDGFDPADMVKNGKLEQLKELFSKPKNLIEFVLEKTVQAYDLNNPKEKEKAFLEAKSFLKSLGDILQNEYKSHLATLLNINSTLIKFNQKSIPLKFSQKRADIAELQIIKTLIENRDLLDTLLDFIDPDMFKSHKEELNLLLNNDFEHQKIVELSLRDEIELLNEHQLRSQLIALFRVFYQNKLSEIKSSGLDYKLKVYEIKRITNIIHKLEKGVVETI